MKSWIKILPFFIVEILSKRWLPKNTFGHYSVVSPFRGVWFYSGPCRVLSEKTAETILLHHFNDTDKH